MGVAGGLQCCVRLKHTGGTMRRTDDGIDPLEVADGGKKFARPNIQEFLFFSSVGGRNPAPPL